MPRACLLALALFCLLLAGCENGSRDAETEALLSKAGGGYYAQHPEALVQPEGVRWSAEARRTARTLYAQYKPGLTNDQRQAIRAGKLFNGMSITDVLVTLGHPELVKHMQTTDQTHELWTYPAASGDKAGKKLYLFFDNQALRNWTER